MNFFQHALKFFIVICFAFVSIGPKMVCAEDQLQQQLQNLQIVAEENFPPISFLNKDGKPDGLAVEIVEEIMKRLKIKQKIVVWPWVRAYRKTVKGPNFVLFSIARTAEREPLFQWTSSIFQMKSSFYAKKDSGLKINSLDDAKKLNIIGSYRDCFEEQFLKKEGFKNLSLVTNNILNVKKLIRGRINAMTATNITLSSLVKSAGDDYKMNDIEKMFTFLVTENYIAFSRQVPVEVVNVWQQTLEDIKSEGLLIEIQKKWLQ